VETQQVQTFDSITEFPDPHAGRRYNRLVGLDRIKERLGKEARILLNPILLNEWSKKHHGKELALVSKFVERSPLFIFAGDVGTGKTELAETFGDQIAREEHICITLYRLSLGTRGTGAVGDMTRRISSAFTEVTEVAKAFRSDRGKKHRSAVILLIDEADAIAQSRDLGQMHHEDRAGVNALIRGVSSFASGELPAIAVMCTNRVTALDPAVRRRAADIFEFERPDEDQRMDMLRTALKDIGFSDTQLRAMAKQIGPNGHDYGFTYSDIAQRLLPHILVDAFPDRPVTFERAIKIAKEMDATAPFKE
jgi:AAA+ superfamily predicted ATPase